jgi:hypothetical protein
MGLRGPHAAPKAWWRYQPKPAVKVRCRHCYRLFIGDRSTANFCSDACKQADYRERVASKKNYDDRAIYVLTLRAEKHVTDPIKSLRALLKIAGRHRSLSLGAHFAVAITKYPTVRPWMKLNALADHIGGPWLGFGCHRRAPAGMTVNTVNTPRSQIAKLICESTCWVLCQP